MNVDNAALEVLSRSQCLALLATAPIGRIVFTDRALPAILPVTFVMDEETVVIRTAHGSKLSAAARHAIVAFQADDLDPDLRAGWSVTVVGRAKLADDPAEILRLARLPLRPWAPGRSDHFIVVGTEQITGRRIPSNGQSGQSTDRTRIEIACPGSAGAGRSTGSRGEGPG